LRLAKTCPANPEQYDVFHGKRLIGYLRLRHGRFTVDWYPNGKYDKSAVELLRANTIGDGEFDASEREKFLSVAKTLLRKAFEMKE
jgi:hypothetical protein